MPFMTPAELKAHRQAKKMTQAAREVDGVKKVVALFELPPN